MTTSSTLLITGGAGYIGSHAVLHFLELGYRIVVVDNLCNSYRDSLKRVCSLTQKSISFYHADVRDYQRLIDIMHIHKPEAVVHFAGLKAVGESVEKPELYYDNNVAGSISLLRAMQACGIKRLVFSSSATVYGTVEPPLHEDCPTSAINPYGQSKKMVEDILMDMSSSDHSLQIALLRYFNPVGAHASGVIGEMPQGTPNNLMPFIAQVAMGQRSKLSIYGDDYQTLDGTGVRDYIHVMDLVEGHSAALDALKDFSGQPLVCNLGVGHGYSVLQVLRAFEQASGKIIPFEVVGRRSGDTAICFADTTRATQLLGWTAKRGLQAMCEDAWRWQSQNPKGFA